MGVVGVVDVLELDGIVRWHDAVDQFLQSLGRKDRLVRKFLHIVVETHEGLVVRG